MNTTNIEKLKRGIDKIGNKLVKCRKYCDGLGISNESEKGIIPRCLYFENKNRNKNKGCVVVGINPGRSKPDERKFYLDKEISYKKVIDYFEEEISEHKYYIYLRKFVDLMGYKGPILWTELVKCENDSKTKFPPLQTFRACTKIFLSKELELVPDNWPLIAIGREAHKALSYLYPDRSVLGVPHPTGSYGYFNKLFTDINKNCFTEDIRQKIKDLKDRKNHM